MDDDMLDELGDYDDDLEDAFEDTEDLSEAVC